MYFGREVDALALGLVEHGGEETHLELEGEHVHARGAALAAFGDDLLDEQPPDGQVDWADDDQPAGVLAVEEARVRERLGAIGAQDQLAELALLLRQRLFLLFAAEPAADVEVGLALVTAEVQYLEGSERLARRLQLALHLDQPLARGVDGELAEVGADPLAPELLRHRRRGAGAAEEVGDEIAFVAAGFDDAFE